MVPIDKCGGCRAIQAHKEVLVRTEILDARSVSVCERDNESDDAKLQGNPGNPGLSGDDGFLGPTVRLNHCRTQLCCESFVCLDVCTGSSRISW